MLSDTDLKKLSLDLQIVSPFIEENCEGATINLTLSSKVKKYNSKKEIILGNNITDEQYQEIDISLVDFYLQPSESVLVQSNEYFKVPTNMASLILERYSVKLLGLIVSPASYMNPGYEGTMSFVAINVNSVPIRLTPGIKFSQVAFFNLTSESEKPYGKQNAKYMKTSDVSISKLHLDQEIQNFLTDRGIKNISKEAAKELGRYLMGYIKNAARENADLLRKVNCEVK